MTVHVVVDEDVCLGSGNCAQAAPALFVLDSDAVAHVVPSPSEPDRQSLLGVARACPSGAIELFDGDTRVDPFDRSES